MRTALLIIIIINKARVFVNFMDRTTVSQH